MSANEEERGTRRCLHELSANRTIAKQLVLDAHMIRVVVHVHADVALSAMVGIDSQPSSMATQLAVRTMVFVKNRGVTVKGYELIQ